MRKEFFNSGARVFSSLERANERLFASLHLGWRSAARAHAVTMTCVANIAARLNTYISLVSDSLRELVLTCSGSCSSLFHFHRPSSFWRCWLLSACCEALSQFNCPSGVIFDEWWLLVSGGSQWFFPCAAKLELS